MAIVESAQGGMAPEGSATGGGRVLESAQGGKVNESAWGGRKLRESVHGGGLKRETNIRFSARGGGR